MTFPRSQDFRTLLGGVVRQRSATNAPPSCGANGTQMTQIGSIDADFLDPDGRAGFEGFCERDVDRF